MHECSNRYSTRGVFGSDMDRRTCVSVCVSKRLHGAHHISCASANMQYICLQSMVLRLLLHDVAERVLCAGEKSNNSQ